MGRLSPSREIGGAARGGGLKWLCSQLTHRAASVASVGVASVLISSLPPQMVVLPPEHAIHSVTCSSAIRICGDAHLWWPLVCASDLPYFLPVFRGNRTLPPCLCASMKSKLTKAINLEVDSRTLEDLRSVCLQSGCNFEQLVCALLAEYVSEQSRRVDCSGQRAA